MYIFLSKATLFQMNHQVSHTRRFVQDTMVEKEMGLKDSSSLNLESRPESATALGYGYISTNY